MATTKSNKLFTNQMTKATNPLVSKVKLNRTYLASAAQKKELNVYAAWDPFHTNGDTYAVRYDLNGKEVKETPESSTAFGLRSLFNRAGAVLIGKNSHGNFDILDQASNWRIGLNAPLLDAPETRKAIRTNSGCSVKELVEASQHGMLGREIYSYADFMYCKYLGRIPNNYMITLRRFPIPVDDYIGSEGTGTQKRDKQLRSQNMQSFGCMVTWMGTPGNDMQNVLKYSVSMPFKQKTAQWESSGGGGGDTNQGPLNSIAAAMDPAYRKAYNRGYGGQAFNAHVGKMFGCTTVGPNPMGHYDQNKVYGPIDAVKDVYMRSEEGLKFEQKLTMTFEYELRSYDGINGRQAMLELIANILNVCYNTGTFWGGGYRGSGMHQNNIFANLKVFKCSGGFTDFCDAIQDDFKTLSTQARAKVDAAGGGIQGLINLAKQALNQLGGMIMGGMLNKLGRPARGAANSLLSPAPIGFWHVTIGNPHHPIMSIGNLVLKNTTIEHTGPLGLDDFPTGLKVTCELERGKARDIREIEDLYMKGQDRIYTSMSEKVFEMYKYAKEVTKSSKDYAYEGQSDNEKMWDIQSDFVPTPDGADGDEKKQDGNNNGKEDTKKSDTASKNADDKDADKKKQEDPPIEYEGQRTKLTSADVDILQSHLGIIQKYFGESDVYSIYFAAAEQEYGATVKKVKKTNTNKQGAVADNNKGNNNGGKK